ncbi:DUF3099 domain-containing protein [Streptomyces sp. NPDC052236]|uniref:DUF3099 domain-containing protein n=1 Tax=Streptomyces sp. NPDC052236 TaxID=3365686 RepID=UPI0037D8A936
MARKHGTAEVFRITGARQGLADDVRKRQRRYVISMLVRTVAVVLAAVLWDVQRHVAIVALVIGVLLPYIAVVIANGGRENTPSLPSTFLPAPSRPMISPMSTAGSASASAPVSTHVSGESEPNAGNTERDQQGTGQS